MRRAATSAATDAALTNIAGSRKITEVIFLCQCNKGNLLTYSEFYVTFGRATHWLSAILWASYVTLRIDFFLYVRKKERFSWLFLAATPHTWHVFQDLVLRHLIIQIYRQLNLRFRSLPLEIILSLTKRSYVVKRIANFQTLAIAALRLLARCRYQWAWTWIWW